MAMQMQKAVQQSIKLINCNNTRSVATLLNECVTIQTPNNNNKLHVTIRQNYPQAAVLPLPPNIDPTECNRFSPQRSREITANAINVHEFSIDVTHMDTASVETSTQLGLSDPHIGSYDCSGALSTSCMMQTSVPEPFGGMHKFSHLNMPGGGWEQTSKFVSHDLQSSHYTNLRQEVRKNWSNYNSEVVNKSGTLSHNKRHFSTGIASSLNNWPLPTNPIRGRVFLLTKERNFSTGPASDAEKKSATNDGKPVSRKDKLKKAVKEYGSTVIIFHVGISLASLGTCYLLVSSGLDVVALLDRLGLEAMSNKAAAGTATTFVTAYAIHKIFAPVRISVTLFSAPFIVRFLRNKGILKPPKVQ